MPYIEKNLNKKIIDDLCEMSENDDKKITEYAKDYLREFNRKGNEYRNIFYTFSFLILAVSALTPLLNSLVGQDNKIVFLGFNIQTIKFYTSVLAVVSAVSAGSLQIVQASDRLILERITKINLEREIVLYKTNGGIYSTDNNPRLEKIQKSGASLASARTGLFSQTYNRNNSK